MKRLLSSLLHNQSGATAIEYGLLLALIALAILASLGGITNGLNKTLGTAENALTP